MKGKEIFSEDSDSYEKYRPSYPNELFAFLASLTTSRELAWDCGTGNGQAARSLVRYFDRVIATDASPEQIRRAKAHDRVRFDIATAEKAPIASASADLITVASAVHWFDLGLFYDEVRRVAKSGGVIALWCNGVQSVNPEVDSLISQLETTVLGRYWPPERQLLQERYLTLPFPFEETKPPSFVMNGSWDLHHFLGYLRTWSSAIRYRKEHGTDPLMPIVAELREVWDDPNL